MANSFVISSLPDYVDQNRDAIISTSVIGARTPQLFTKQSGVKGSAAINILSSAVTFGEGCGWAEAGTSTLSQRTIVTGDVKINMAFCDRALAGKWAEKEIEIKANPDALPFEQEVVASVVESVQSALDYAIWQGDTTSSTANLNKFDGLLKILGAESSVITSTVASGTTKINAVKQVLLAMPAKTIKDDAVIFCSPEFLREYEQELVTANLYHFEPDADYSTITIPGSSVKLVAVEGLTGASNLVAGRLSNFFYGYDIEDSKEACDIWYSKDNQEFRLAMYFNAGVQVAFPAEVVLATLA